MLYESHRHLGGKNNSTVSKVTIDTVKRHAHARVNEEVTGENVGNHTGDDSV